MSGVPESAQTFEDLSMHNESKGGDSPRSQTETDEFQQRRDPSPIALVIRPPQETPFQMISSFTIVDGLLHVSDFKAGGVFCFRLDGAFVRFDPRDVAHKKLRSSPWGIAAAEGLIIIGNRNAKQINAYGPDGLQFSWNVPFYPGALTYGDGLIYIAEWEKSRIHAYRLDGTLQTSFGSAEDEGGRLKRCSHLSYSDGRLYVCSFMGHSISTFRADGSLVSVWGTKGTRPGQMKYPTGTAVIGSRVIVTEAGNCVSVWTIAGAFLGRLTNLLPNVRGADLRGIAVSDGFFFLASVRDKSLLGYPLKILDQFV